LASETEALLKQQRRHLRSEIERADLAGLRNTVSELSTPLNALHLTAPALSKGVSAFAAGTGERFRSKTGMIRSGAAVGRPDAPWPLCSSDESLLPKEFARKLDGEKMDPEAPTPSSSSATSPTGPPLPEVPIGRDGFSKAEKAESADYLTALNAALANAAATSLASESRTATCAAAAAAAGELPEFLRNWRKELRRDHATLDEDRRLWRGEARRVKQRNLETGDLFGGAKRGSAELEILAEVRATLDARAAKLNNSIGEYRALEKLHTGGSLKRSSSQRARSGGAGASRGTSASRRRSSSAAALGERVRPSSTPAEDGLGCRFSASTKSAPQEEELLRRWQHVLHEGKGGALLSKTAQQQLRSGSWRTVPPLSSRVSLLNLPSEGVAALRTCAGGG
jgi:hypothetical protein